jgi:16S rRNA (guanine966-N2)-methyltransferase
MYCMRVIAGRHRGRRLIAPRGASTRPVTDRAKETIFNVLARRVGEPGRLPPVDVLDLFAGSGGLGIEALSRGARGCVFVERDRRAARALRENLTLLKLGPIACVRMENAWTMRFPQASAGFGLVFVDPPYADAEDDVAVTDLLDRLAPRVAADGVVVFRYEASVARSFEALRGLWPWDQRALGKMWLAFLSPEAPAGAPAPAAP